MQSRVYRGNIEKVARQRNMFMGIAAISLSCCMLVSIKLVTSTERMILVPGLQKEAWVSNSGVSASYIEEMTSMYLTLLLDLDSTSIDWKRDRIMGYVARSNASYIKNLTEYFARVKEQYQQFSLSTHFALKKLDIDSRKLKAHADGLLISRFGDRGIKTTPASYLLSFELVAGRLWLKEFVKIEEAK